MADPTERHDRRGRHGGRAGIDPANSMLVHDVKNLSFRLGTLLRNLENNYEDPLFKQSVVDVLSDTVDQMDRIVRRSRDRRGDILIKVPLDLNEVLHRCVESLPRQERRRLLIEESYSRIPKIWADAEYIENAFGIILQNAVEAMDEERGRLSVETESVTTRSGKRFATVSFSDTGCGMSPEFIRTVLFAPFATTKETGLGMGMYTCRRIVELHDGSIRVLSREGRGTTFRIRFRVER